MPADDQRILKPSDRQRKEKTHHPTGYRFLNQVLPRIELEENRNLIKEEDVAALAARLGREYPGGCPIQALRRLFTDTDGKDTLSASMDGDGLHLSSYEEVAEATEFAFLPIDFAERLPEGFRLLTLRTLRSIAIAYGMDDIRKTIYFEYAKELNEELVDESDTDEADEDFLHAQFRDWTEGETGARMDAFWDLENMDFDLLRAYVPTEEQRPLHSVLLEAEDILRTAVPLTMHTRSRMRGAEETVALDDILCVSYSRSGDITDDIEDLINNDINSGSDIDLVISEICLDKEDRTESDTLRKMTDYYFRLSETISLYE